MIRSGPVLLLAFLCLGCCLEAQPGQNPSNESKPSEVFREFAFNVGATPEQHFAELDPNATFQRLANLFGQFHNYSFNSLEVPLALLKAGTNEVSLFSTFKGHAIEINWPGPVLLLELNKP